MNPKDRHPYACGVFKQSAESAVATLRGRFNQSKDEAERITLGYTITVLENGIRHALGVISGEERPINL